MMNILILQSLKRAQYSTKEMGHFGLQLKSILLHLSIRRYPIYIAWLIKNVSKNKQKISQDKLEETLNELSSLEKRAEHASDK